jgi:hypothetical protein
MGLTIIILVMLAMFGGVDLAISAQSSDRSVGSLVAIANGGLPIILSAPHGGQEAIPGVSQRQGRASSVSTWAATRAPTSWLNSSRWNWRSGSTRSPSL